MSLSVPFGRDDASSEGGQLSVDRDGQLQVDVDDDFYSGRATRSESVTLAHAILDWNDPAPRDSRAVCHYRVVGGRLQFKVGDDAGAVPRDVSLSLARAILDWKEPEPG